MEKITLFGVKKYQKFPPLIFFPPPYFYLAKYSPMKTQFNENYMIKFFLHCRFCSIWSIYSSVLSCNGDGRTQLSSNCWNTLPILQLLRILCHGRCSLPPQLQLALPSNCTFYSLCPLPELLVDSSRVC